MQNESMLLPQCYCGEFPGKDDIREKVCDSQIYRTIDDKSYCVLHYPASDKWGAFWSVVKNKLERGDFKFTGAWFPEDKEREYFEKFHFNNYADFTDATFSENINFREAKFDRVRFSRANFKKSGLFFDSEFLERVDFDSAEFMNAEFGGVAFRKEANFDGARFMSKANFFHADFFAFAHFREAKFNQLDFSEAVFAGISFDKTVFGDPGSQANTRASFKKATFKVDVSSFAIESYLPVDFDEASFLTDAHFRNAEFKRQASFVSTSFQAKTFFVKTIFTNSANFSVADFAGEADFTDAHFSKIHGALFYRAKFARDVFFDRTEFAGNVSFNSAVFGGDSDMIFRNSEFAGDVSFIYSTSDGYLRFIDLKQGEGSRMRFEEAAFEKATRISFHTVRLQPHWFVNIDSRKFVFTNCRWKQPDNTDIDLRSELEALGGTRDSHKLLTKTCWQLADNHEEMKSFPKASIFRQMANESKRLEDYRGWKVWSLHWWYWLSSFYGERPLRAGLVLLGILLAFALAFMVPEFQVCPIEKTVPEKACDPLYLSFAEAILQSLATATFQSIEYIKPQTMPGTFLIILEKILAPIQAALFALAIRRKFMR